MERVYLGETERIDDLLTKNLKIIQSNEVFSFSMDAVLLSHFVSLPVQKGKIIDLCTGNGVIPLLLSTRTKGVIHGVEIQDRLADMAKRNVELNHVMDRIHIYHDDVKEASKYLIPGSYDVLTCNPPYLPLQRGMHNANDHFSIARHEIKLTLEEMIQVSAKLVRTGGKVAYVHRPSRLVDLMMYMRKYKIEPKRIRFVYPKKNVESNMVLIEGIRDGKPDVKLLPPLIVYEENGEYCQEIYEIYYKKIGGEKTC